MSRPKAYWGRVTGRRLVNVNPFSRGRLLLDDSSITLAPVLGRRTTIERGRIEAVELVDTWFLTHLRFRKVDGTLIPKAFRPARPNRVCNGLLRGSWPLLKIDWLTDGRIHWG